MNMRGAKTGWIVAAFAAAGLVVSPAIGNPNLNFKQRRAASVPQRAGIGSFTPAAADPRLAAAFARSGLANTGFRFTPATTKAKPSGVVKVAVRARSSVAPLIVKRSTPQALAAVAAPTPTVSIAPVAYNLGVSVGWKRFAVSGDVIRSDTGPLPGGREGAALGLSYSDKRWSTRLQVEADRPVGRAPRQLQGGESIALDVGTSYSLSRSVDVTAGVRYRAERNRDRLERLQDDRRDSQAVYIGTAFKF
jgi:hypothetical protein